MDEFTKTMTGTAVGLGSVALVGRAAQMVPKDFGMSKKRKKVNFMKQNRNMTRGFMDITVGTALLSGTSSMIK